MLIPLINLLSVNWQICTKGRTGRGKKAADIDVMTTPLLD